MLHENRLSSKYYDNYGFVGIVFGYILYCPLFI